MARLGRSFPLRKNIGQSTILGPVGGLGQFSFNGTANGFAVTSGSATFSFGGTASNSVIPYHYDGPSLQIVQDDLDVFNDAQAQSGRSGSILQEWGPIQASVAAVSASVYGTRTVQGLTSLQQQYDSDALALAQNYVIWYNSALPRVQQMMLLSSTDEGNNIAQMLERGLLDRFTVRYQGQNPGTPFSQDSLIESITHNISLSSGPLWTTTYALSPYEIIMKPWVFGVTGQDAFGGSQVLTL